MKTTLIAVAIAQAVLHAHEVHDVPYDDIFAELTQQQISTMYLQQWQHPLPPADSWGTKPPEGKVVVTISSIIDLGNDKYAMTVGNDGCVADDKFGGGTFYAMVLDDANRVIGMVAPPPPPPPPPATDSVPTLGEVVGLYEQAGFHRGAYQIGDDQWEEAIAKANAAYNAYQDALAAYMAQHKGKV